MTAFTNIRTSLVAAAAVLTLGLGSAGGARAQESQHERQAAQREAIAKLRPMQGVWVGPANGMNGPGQPFAVTQTERIGPMLDGSILVIEGRGYNPDGTTGFNAFAVVSYEPDTGKYEMRSYAQGRAGTFELTPTDNGYVWEVPAGPGVVRYVADITDTTFHEVGDFVMPGVPAQRIFEMTLTRRGDSDWPAQGAVDPRP